MPAHGQHRLKPFLALSSVLPEPLDEGVLDAVLDALPATSQGGDLGLLVELGLVGIERRVDDGLLDVEQVAEGDVGGDHGDCLGLGVDVGGLKHLRLIYAAAQHALEPFRSGLTAGDETLSTQDAGGRVDVAADGVDGDNMRRLLVPWAVLPPVAGGDLFPGVIEGFCVGKDLHFD